MNYRYNHLVSLAENLLEIEVYGQGNTESQEEVIRTHLLEEEIGEDDIEKLIVAYLRGLNHPN